VEVGTGIFLSACVLGVVGLYATTKDRWRWKRIALAMVGVFALAALTTGTWLWQVQQASEKATALSEFWDLRVGMTADEVRFRKGEPKRNIEGQWVYDVESKYEPTYVIGFQAGKVRFVSAYGDPSALPAVAGLSPYSGMEQLEDKLGPATHVSKSTDGLKRILSFERYNLVVEMKQNQIYALGMYDTGLPALQFKEER
jgi:hypothetical protein